METETETETEQAADEIRRLKTCINDLISVQALPAIWSGGQPSRIISALLDALLEILDLDFVYARLKDSVDGAPVETVQFAQGRNLTVQPQEIGRVLNPCLGDDSHASSLRVRNPVGDRDVSIVPLRLGLQDEMGVLVAASERVDFPTQTEKLLLKVAANQAAIGLHEVRRLSEQRRVARELDQQVARRTSELVALNEELRKEITERKRAEQRLLQSEAYLAEAQRLSLTGSFGWNVSSGELIWSKETFCMLDYDPATKPTLELVFKRVHPEDRALVQQTIDRATRGENGIDFEHRLLMPDGSVKHVRVVARAVRVESSAVEFVGAVMDITERKKSQDAMRAAKARFEGILGIAEDAIISVDSDQHIALFNRGAEKVFGYTQGEIMGKSLDLLIPPRFASTHQKHLQEFAQSADIARVMGQRREVFGVRKDGQEFPAEASISKLNLDADVVYTVMLRDITERKQAAEALHRSEHVARGQLSALTHTLNALAQESDPDRLLEHVLRTIVDQFGAHSVLAWQRNDGDGYFDLIAVIAEGRFQPGNDAIHTAGRIPILAQNHPAFSEILRTGQHGVLEDIDQPTARMCVGSGPDVVWHRVLEDTDPDPAMVLLKKRLQELGIRAILFVPMLIVGRVTGFIGIRFKEKRVFRGEEIELTRALAHQATLAIQLIRLSQQSRHAAVVAERDRLARDIHDTLAQGFTGVIVQLEAAADATSKGLAKEAQEHLDRAGDLARESLKEARRSVRALRPQALEENDLCEALDRLIRKMTAGTALRAVFSVRGRPLALPPDWEENLLRIGQEVLTNALRHAHASEFKAKLVFDTTEIRLELCDNGHGFDPAARHDGFGLLGIGERVEGIGGRLSIESTPGRGAAIVIILPLMKIAQSSPP